jgi:hypothetical protein
MTTFSLLENVNISEVTVSVAYYSLIKGIRVTVVSRRYLEWT